MHHCKTIISEHAARAPGPLCFSTVCLRRFFRCRHSSINALSRQDCGRGDGDFSPRPAVAHGNGHGRSRRLKLKIGAEVGIRRILPHTVLQHTDGAHPLAGTRQIAHGMYCRAIRRDGQRPGLAGILPGPAPDGGEDVFPGKAALHQKHAAP